MQRVIGTIGIATLGLTPLAYGPLISSVSTLSSSIISIIGCIKISKDIHQNEIINILTKTDIVSTIKLLQIIINEIPQSLMNSFSVIIALKNVQEIISEINDELKKIHEKISYNNSLYISNSLRKYDCTENLISIEIKISILDRRKDNLFKVLEVFKNININHTEEDKQKMNKFLEMNNKEDNGFELI